MNLVNVQILILEIGEILLAVCFLLLERRERKKKNERDKEENEKNIDE